MIAMAYLTDAQRNILAPAHAAHPRDGALVAGSNAGQFATAACWCWALCGDYEHVDGPYTAVTIYNSANGVFTFNAQQAPTGLNAAFFQLTDEIFPQTRPYHQTLHDNLPNALAGNAAARDACRLALMKLTATLNGHTVLADDGSPVYTMVMRSNSWYGWDHWAIGVQGAGGGPITYQQKVTDSGLKYNCGTVWDEGLAFATTIRIDGLLPAQVTWLNRAT